MGFERDRLPDPATYLEGRGLKLTGPRSAKWKTTRCEFHGGSDSMRVNTTTGAWVCMSCGAKGGDVLAYEVQASGADFQAAARALGAWVEDGRPPPKQNPLPLPPRAALEVLAFEVTVIAVAAGNVAHGVPLTETDLNRVLHAAGRVNMIAQAYQ